MKRRKLVVLRFENQNNSILCDYGCGNPAKYLIGVAKRPCCSNSPFKCQHVIQQNVNNGRATKKERYGSETYNNSKQRAETNLSKYGNICSLHGKEQEEMTKNTFITKYGVDCAFKSPEIQAKVTNTIRKNHGVDNPWQIPEVIAGIREKRVSHQKEATNKAIQTRKSWNAEKINEIKQQTKITFRTRRYSQLFDNPYVEPMFSLEQYLVPNGSLIGMNFQWKCKICDNEFISPYKPFKPISDCDYIYGRCPKCFLHAKSDGVSIEELGVLDFVKSIYSGPIFHSKRILRDASHKYQIDIYLPDLKFGIEYNGLYFHQVKNCPIKHYHLVKTEIAESLGIRLFHLRSDLWKTESLKFKCIIKSIIDNNFSVSNFYNDSEVIVVDRSLFNKNFVIPNYQLTNITQPTILNITDNSQIFEYEDCGSLIYSKIKC